MGCLWILWISMFTVLINANKSSFQPYKIDILLCFSDWDLQYNTKSRSPRVLLPSFTLPFYVSPLYTESLSFCISTVLHFFQWMPAGGKLPQILFKKWPYFHFLPDRHSCRAQCPSLPGVVFQYIEDHLNCLLIFTFDLERSKKGLARRW